MAYQCRAVSPQSERSRTSSEAWNSAKKNTFKIPAKIVTALIWVLPIAGNNHDNDGGDVDVDVAWLSGREQQARAALHFGRQGDERQAEDPNIPTIHG